MQLVAVGLQSEFFPIPEAWLDLLHASLGPVAWEIISKRNQHCYCQVLERQQFVPNMLTIIKKRDGNLLLCVQNCRYIQAGAFDQLKHNTTKAKIPFYRRCGKVQERQF